MMRTSNHLQQRMQSIPATSTRTGRPSVGQTTPATKKYKAPLSAESRKRTLSTPTLGSSYSRPKTPLTSRPKTPTSRAITPGPPDDVSEWDVSKVDPEEALVDWQTVEAADVSLEAIDLNLAEEKKRDDKVLVSIRVKPTEAAPAWKISNKTIRLDPKHAPGKGPQEFTFDHVLTGSENKPVYTAVARNHVIAAMEGYNAVVFAYGQTASGKTFTLSGDEDQPGIIPRALRDIFGYIRRTPSREYLLRCSYLEIYNENIHDLLAPSSNAQPVMIHGTAPNIILSPLREEVVTSLKSVKAVLERGERNRRTASTDWNARSSRSHSVFRVVIESRERDETRDRSGGRATPSGRQTPGTRPPTPGGARLQAIGGRSVQTSTLSLIDLAGSEKATSDKERTREGRYINTSLLTLGTVISTLAENTAKRKSDHVPFRNSKLTRLLQPSLSGDALISVICTLHPGSSYLAETLSTLSFATRVRGVKLSATKKEVVDTDALLERYRKEIEDLKSRLKEREDATEEGSPLKRRLSAREQMDESKAMRDLNSRIRQLTKLILTSSTVDPLDPSRPGSPFKLSRPGSPIKGSGPFGGGDEKREGELDWSTSSYDLHRALVAARREIESQAVQILSLEAALAVKSKTDAEGNIEEAEQEEDDKAEKNEAMLNGELSTSVKPTTREEQKKATEDIVQTKKGPMPDDQWQTKYENEKKTREEGEAWASDLVRQLDKERTARMKLEEERHALVAFVRKFDSLSLGGGGDTSASLGLGPAPSSASTSGKVKPPLTTTGGTTAPAVFKERQRNRLGQAELETVKETEGQMRLPSGVSMNGGLGESLLEEKWAWEGDGGVEDLSFDLDGGGTSSPPRSLSKGVFGEKENVPVSP